MDTLAPRRTLQILAAAIALAVLIVAGVVLARELWPQPAGAAAGGGVLPAIPALAGWSEEFADRVRNAHEAAARAGASPAALVALGALYHANGFSAEAEEVWRALIVLEPRVARWPYYLADLHQNSAHPGDPETHLEEVLRLAPDYAPAHLRLAEVRFKQGRYAEAAPHYEARLALLPGDPYARLGLARIFLQNPGDLAVARRSLEKLVLDHPGFSSAHNVLAELFAAEGDATRAALHRRLGHEAGRFREADDAWIEHIQLSCYDPYRLEVLGATRLQTGRVKDSLLFFEKALSLAPRDGGIHEALGDAYQRLNRLAEARRVLEAGLAVSPRTQTLYIRLAQVLREEGRASDAAAVLRRGLAALPEQAELQSELGIALEDAGRQNEAVAAYREAIRLNAHLVEAHLNLGLCLGDLGRVDEARASLRHVIDVRPGHTEALLALAQLELEAGQLEAAGGHSRRLYELRPEQEEARRMFTLWHVRQGSAEARAGRPAEAEGIFQAGLVVDPRFGELHANLGVLDAQAGRYAEAIIHFERFAEVAPAEPKARLYLGQVQLAAGRPSEARRSLEQALRLARESDDEASASQCEALLAQVER